MFHEDLNLGCSGYVFCVWVCMRRGALVCVCAQVRSLQSGDDKRAEPCSTVWTNKGIALLLAPFAFIAFCNSNISTFFFLCLILLNWSQTEPLNFWTCCLFYYFSFLSCFSDKSQPCLKWHTSPLCCFAWIVMFLYACCYQGIVFFPQLNLALLFCQNFPCVRAKINQSKWV